MSVSVIVNGAFGNMGALACKTLNQHSEFNVVAQCGRDDDLAAVIKDSNADVVLDLTSAQSVKENCRIILAQGLRMVIGSSGLNTQDIQDLSELCEQQSIGALIVPNFSMGALLMMHFASLAAKLLPEAEIIEAHHPGKVDAPSGTAIKTAQMINQARATKPQPWSGEVLVSGARGAEVEGIPVHSMRLPGVVARQSVVFGNQGETLTISHDSIDRQSFMPGVVYSCQQVMHLNRLVYGLESLLLSELMR